MRTINEIQIAVQHAEPDITDEELRLCVESLRTIIHFYSTSLLDLIAAVEQGKPSVKLKASFAMETVDRMFAAQKRTPREWLGEDNIPGSDTYNRRLELGRKIFKAATGKDL